VNPLWQIVRERWTLAVMPGWRVSRGRLKDVDSDEPSGWFVNAGPLFLFVVRRDS